MNQGKIVRWVEDRGFGFVRPDDGDSDVFVHFRDVDGPRPSVGDRVAFDVEVDGMGKRRAVRATRI
jgi:cold shock CspA family protein